MQRTIAFHSWAAHRQVIFSLFLSLLAAACGEGPTPPPPPPVPTVTGRVTNSGTGVPVVGAEVHVGAAVATTIADGRFSLRNLPTGTATLRCTAPGFRAFEAEITVTSTTVTRNVGLTRIELFEFGDYALFVPATVDQPRAVLLALGGPDTRAFATGKPFGAPIPEVETSLQALGQAYRALAASRSLAILGTSLAAMPNGADSDHLLFDAINTAGGMSGHPELPAIPMFLYGMSGGGPQASGFTARNPGRVAGLFLKVPAGVASLTNGSALHVPTYMVLAELDAFVDNTALTTAFEANRQAGALWALAKEPGVAHHSLSPAQRQLTIDWIAAILDLRMLYWEWPGDQMYQPLETDGWLGDRATGEVWRWDAYPGDRTLASWLPSENTAHSWALLTHP